MKRRCATMALGSFCAAPWMPALATSFPSRPVKVLVGYPPGSPIDLSARRLGQGIGPDFGQPVVVENRPGASGTIAAEQVARASADGYVLLAATVSEIAINRPAGMRMNFDPERDFVPVAMLFGTSPILLTRPDARIGSTDALIRAAREQPGRLNWASVNAFQSVLMKSLQRTLGVDLNIVAYKGTQQALGDLLGGQIDGMVGYVAEMAPYIQAGRISGVAILSSERHALLPDLPTLRESVPAAGELAEINVWGGLFAPAGTQPQVVGAMHRVVESTVASPAAQAAAAKAGYSVRAYTVPQFAAFVSKEISLWDRLVRESNFRLG